MRIFNWRRQCRGNVVVSWTYFTWRQTLVGREVVRENMLQQLQGPERRLGGRCCRWASKHQFSRTLARFEALGGILKHRSVAVHVSVSLRKIGLRHAFFHRVVV